MSPRNSFWRCLLAAVMLFATASFANAEDRPFTKFVQGLFGLRQNTPAVQQPRAAIPAAIIDVAVEEEEPLGGVDAAEQAAEDDEPELLPSHTETGIIKVKSTGGCSLNSFCVSPDGHIYAACGNSAKSNGQIEVFTADGKSLHTWTVPIVTQSINFSPDGKLFVAGEGEIAQISDSGTVIAKWATPNAADVEKNADAIIERTIASRKSMQKQYARIADQFDDQIQKLEEKEDATATEMARVKTMKTQVKMYRQLADTSDEALASQAKAALKAKMKISALGITDKEVFVACSATEGYGFDVWRADHKLENAEKVISGLRGCCGQMDIQCCNGEIFVAENARHRVCRYSRDGKLLSTFGEKARSGSKGFGSCCNPMNLRFGTNGELYTSESSVGRIKKYTVDGKLLGVVGKAKIVPGCKNVSIGLSPKGDRVYMMDLTRSHIVIMSGPTADDAPKAVSQVTTKK